MKLCFLDGTHAHPRSYENTQINELIARTPEEIDLFNKIDEEHRAEEDERVRRGVAGPLARLMVLIFT